jgi:hypothetical protein
MNSFIFMKKIIIVLLVIGSVIACRPPKGFVNKDIPNTPATGFNTEGSDAKAIALADSVMKAVGGRYAWDMTRFIRWNFMGRRTLVWDKWQDRVRIDFNDNSMKIRLNMKDMTGRVWKDGQEMTHPDSLSKYLLRGKNIWINDAYWMVMPFKLKDSGVTLKYLGSKPNQLGAACEVLELTFKSVGVTPDNKYWVYINPSSKLVTQWDFFGKYSDEKPNMSTPWQDYRPLGNIILSGDRGQGRTMLPMGVYKSIPDSVFTSLYDIDWKKIK